STPTSVARSASAHSPRSTRSPSRQREWTTWTAEPCSPGPAAARPSTSASTASPGLPPHRPHGVTVMTPPDRALISRGWTPTRLVALIWRLVADLAVARGYTVAQMARHYCLPDRPYMSQEAHR